MDTTRNLILDPRPKTAELPARRLTHLLGFLFLVAALSVAGTYWMVATLQQAIQMELPVPGSDAKTLQS